MYVATSISQGHPYDDLNFVQGPLTYWFWSGIYGLSDDSSVYLTMRLVSATLVGFSIAFPAILLFPSRFDTAIFVMLSISSYYVLRAGWEVGNYSLTLALTSIGATALLQGGPKNATIGGLFLASAATAKISFVLLMAPGLLAAILNRRSEPSSTVVFAFGLGAVTGLLPMLIVAFDNPAGYFFHNVTFHSDLTNRFRDLSTMDSLHSIISGMMRWIGRQAAVIITVAALTLVIVRTRRLRTVSTSPIAPQVLSLAVFLGFSIAMAWSPMILFPQYLAPSSFFLILLAVFMTSLCEGKYRRVGKKTIAVIAALSAFYPIGRVTENLFISRKPNFVAEHSRISAEIRAKSAAGSKVDSATGCRKIAVTLSGSLLAGSGLSPSLGSHTGPFWVRVRDVLRPEQAGNQTYRLKPSLFAPESLIVGDRVDYAIVGYYEQEDFEARIKDAAIANGFAEVPLGLLRGKEIVLWKRPEC